MAPSVLCVRLPLISDLYADMCILVDICHIVALYVTELKEEEELSGSLAEGQRQSLKIVVWTGKVPCVTPSHMYTH
jgi:hypothetical protein